MTTAGWRRLARDPAHGPLPVLLLVLTAVTGLIDAFSLLALGRIFVANMTGNILSIGLALAGAPGFVKATSLAALAAYVLGAFAAGRLIMGLGKHRGRLLVGAAAVELVCVLVAAVVAIQLGRPEGSLVAVVVAVLLAFGMAFQNATARRLAVPDLPTTVLTMALTGLAADVHGGGGGSVARRLLSVLALFLGAVTGALLVLHAAPAWALAAAAVLVAIVLVLVMRASRDAAPWHACQGPLSR